MPRVGDTVGGFLLEARLGAGSFGTVFRARRDDRLVALKLLYLPLAGPWAWRELEVLLRLHHVGLLSVECHGHHGPDPELGPLFLYIVTAYVPGQSMDAWAEHTNPTARQVARAVFSLAAQLELAHAAGVVHRDLKPDNVVMRGEDGRPVLVDFGVASFPGALKVTHGPPPGSALMRPPEAWRFRRERPPEERYEATARDDLWALGVLFYWLLVGDWPFEGETEEAWEDAVLHVPPRAPHARNARAPEVLSTVCLRMLEKAPEARYLDATRVCEALEKALEGADATWDASLCEAWEPSWATTVGNGKRSLGQLAARARRLRVEAHARPRRGRPWEPEDEPPLPFAPPEPLPLLGLPSPAPPVIAEVPAGPLPSTSPAVRPVRGWRPSAVVLGALALLCAAHPCASSVWPGKGSSRPGALPGGFATPVSFTVWVLSRQEMAPGVCPLDGDDGALPAWVSTAAPVAFATHSQDGKRMKKDSRKQPQSLSRTVCTTALGALVAGCTSVPVRADPPPADCPADALKAMEQLKVRIGSPRSCAFEGLPLVPTDDSLVIVREGDAVLRLNQDNGQLKEGTILVGRFIFGRERVGVRFTTARVPGGTLYPVCMEIEDVGSAPYKGRGLYRVSGSAPGTAHVSKHPHVVAVERFQ